MLLAIPNISEGRDLVEVDRYAEAVRRGGARVLDIHSDPIHHRSVLTVAGAPEGLIAGVTSLAERTQRIDLTRHSGAHPRVGGLDVCPFVPVEGAMEVAVDAARGAAREIARATGLPVFLYGAAAFEESRRDLPGLRRGGLEGLAARVAQGFEPDEGPAAIDPARGVVLVGARDVLIAFNVWVACEIGTAEHIARAIRSSGGGPPGIRAIAVEVEAGRLCQISMNLVDPRVTGIDDAYEAVARRCASVGVRVVSTELVGLVPQRFMPDPEKPAARLLRGPGRSLETFLER